LSVPPAASERARLVNKLFPSLFGRLFPVYGLDKSGRLGLSDFYGYWWCLVTQNIHPLPVKSHRSRMTDWRAYEYLTSPVCQGKYFSERQTSCISKFERVWKSRGKSPERALYTVWGVFKLTWWRATIETLADRELNSNPTRNPVSMGFRLGFLYIPDFIKSHSTEHIVFI